MRQRWRIYLLLCLLLCVSCSSRVEPQPANGYQLYFPVGAEQSHGPAIRTQPWPGTGTPKPEILLKALLNGPQQEGLISPFPRDVTMVKCTMDSEEPGLLCVILSEQYSALSDVSLTLADYCIVMTLSQFPEVKAVEIQTEDGSYGYRSHQILHREEVELPPLLP